MHVHMLVLKVLFVRVWPSPSALLGALFTSSWIIFIWVGTYSNISLLKLTSKNLPSWCYVPVESNGLFIPNALRRSPLPDSSLLSCLGEAVCLPSLPEAPQWNPL